jgi:excisionase family DNA binding protein
MTADPARWLTVDAAAKEISVSRRTIYHYMKDGKVHWKETAGGSRRILASTLWKRPDLEPQADA